MITPPYLEEVVIIPPYLEEVVDVSQPSWWLPELAAGVEVPCVWHSFKHV